MSASRALIVLAATALVSAGCGGSNNNGSNATHAPGSPAGPSAAPGEQASPDHLLIVVSITNNQVTPVNKQLEAKVKQEIDIKVSSDVDEELHVHSTPEHTFAVKPGAPQTFQFTVDVPGRVDVELHHAGVTIATITVQ